MIRIQTISLPSLNTQIDSDINDVNNDVYPIRKRVASETERSGSKPEKGCNYGSIVYGSMMCTSAIRSFISIYNILSFPFDRSLPAIKLLFSPPPPHEAAVNTARKMSKSCPEHGHKKWPKFWYRLFKYGLVIMFILLVIVLITWAILHPHKPRFVLQDTTLYTFNASTNPSLLTSTFQVTISSRNPNDKIGIYYDRLEVYATYRDQQITQRTRIPRSYEGHKDVDVWSPFIYGNSVPIAPYNSAALSQDQANSYIMVMIKIDGRVRWKVGSFISGGYHIFVRCPAYIPFGNQSKGTLVGNNAVKYQLRQRCDVNV